MPTNPASEAVSGFVVIAKTHLNFYPGTFKLAPPDEIFTLLKSELLPNRDAANALAVELRSTVNRPEEWIFEVMEVKGDDFATQQIIQPAAEAYKRINKNG